MHKIVVLSRQIWIWWMIRLRVRINVVQPWSDYNNANCKYCVLTLNCTRVKKTWTKSSEMTHTHGDCRMQFAEINGDKLNNCSFLRKSCSIRLMLMVMVIIIIIIARLLGFRPHSPKHIIYNQMIRRWEMILIRSIVWAKQKAISKC